MLKLSAFIMMVSLLSCTTKDVVSDNFTSNDSIALLKMVNEREAAMSAQDIAAIVNQFDSTATFINGGGYYYNGLQEIKDFHFKMFTMDSVKYSFETGKTLINPVTSEVALVYYPWQQNWTMKHEVSDTLHEIGLMTIIAVKNNGQWKWKSMTNQRTKEFFPDLTKHKAN